MGLMEDLGKGPIALDTAIFIYWIEENPRYADLLEPVFEAIDRGALPAVTSMVTLLETLVVPYRSGNQFLADQYEAFLTRSRGLLLAPIDKALLRAAALLRATFGCKTPDALQLASALRGGCQAFLTNDRDLNVRVEGLAILRLKDYES